MACTQVCPTQALEKLEPTEKGMRAVKMGLAFVSQDHCYSFAGRTCGVCYRACPLPGRAMTLGLYETPIVHPEHCVGCGLCEQACVQMPQAIRVVPLADQTRIDALLKQPKRVMKPKSLWPQGEKWDDKPSKQ
jgi:NAD-dependent dihydropyrimidine dehydrogenase PreA subunit